MPPLPLPGGPRHAALWAVLLTLCLCLGGCMPRERFAAEVLTLDRGEVFEAGSTWPVDAPAADAAWQPMTLPDAWDSSRPDHQGYAWYRLRFDTPADWRAPLALYLPSVSMNAQVELNGQLLGLQGQMHEPVTRNFYTPLIFALPQAMLQPPGTPNELRILVMGYRLYRSGLGPVSVGPAAPLQAAWSVRRFWQNTGTLITSVLMLGLALAGALLWRRAPRARMYGWFTLAAAVWGVRNLNFVLTDNPFGNLWWNRASLAGAAAFVGLFALFTQDYSRWMQRAPPPRWRELALPLGYVAVCVLLLAVSADTAGLRRLFLALAIAALGLTAWSQWHLTRTAWRAGSRPAWAVALAGAVYLGLMLHDYSVAADRSNVGQLFLRQYAAVPLFMAFTLVWTQRYRQAFEQVELLSQGLQQQVEAQRIELERRVGQLMAAERESLLSHERERLVSDLHDGLGLHLLTALKMARDAGTGREQLAEVLADCLDDLRLAIDSMSNIDERDPVLLLASLRFRLAPRLKAAGVQLDWQVLGEVAPQPWLDAPKALHLLRVVQEALANAVRHAGATRVLLKVEAQAQGVIVSVIDDGRGIDAAAAPAGHGLASMRRRAALLGATLSVGPAPHSGTEVRLVMSG
jgi:signal transduction histidine kinase